MSLNEYSKYPFLKHRDADDTFPFYVIGHGKGRYGLFLKGQPDCSSSLDLDAEKFVQIGLSDPAILFLLHDYEVSHLDLIKGKVVVFQKVNDEYLTIIEVQEPE